MNGGSISGQKTSYNVTTESFTLPTPSRTGYTFTGWTGSNGSTPQKSVTIAKGSTGNKSYTANWSINTYSIGYNLNGGSISGQKTSYNVTTESFTLPTPSRTGYTFTGWTGSNGSTPQKSVTIAKGSTGNKNYTANWSVNKVSIAYNTNGGTINSSDYSINQWGYVQNKSNNPWFHVITYGSTDDPYNASTFGLTRTGYTFVRWQNEKTGTNYDQDTKYDSTAYQGSSSSQTTANTASVDCYVKAIWSLNNYSIGYNLNGGSISGQKTSYNVTTESFTLPTPTRTGYTFTGWTESNGSTPQKSVTIAKGSTGNKSYTANWQANAYTLTVNPNGGNINGTTSAKSLSPPLYYNGGNWWNLNGEKPSRTGYTFEGWYTSTEGGTKIYNTDGTCTNEGTYWKNNSYVHTGNLSVYAHWKANTYTITSKYFYYYQNNTWKQFDTKTEQRTYGSSFAPHNVNSPTGYHAGNNYGYYTEKSEYLGDGTVGTNNITVNQNIIVHIHYYPNTYTITYKSNGGSGSDQTQTATYGISWTTKGAIYSKSGYTQTSWNTQANGSGTKYSLSTAQTDKQLSNVTLYAQYSANTYYVTYNANGGSGAPAQQAFVYNSGAKISTTKPTRTGYTFVNWDYGGTKFNPGDAIPSGWGSFTLKAQWKANSYTITYSANGGSGAPAQQAFVYNSGAKISTTKPTRTGYTFVNWDYGGTKFNPGDAIPSGWGSFTLKAQWKANSYTITYSANGGSGAPDNQTKVAGQTLTLSSTKPTRSGYTFRGWKEISKTNKYYQPGSSYTNDYNGETITMRAVWVKNSGDWGNATRRDYGWYQTMNNGKYAVSHWIYYYIDTNARQIRVVVDNQRLQSLTNRHAYYYGTNNGWQLNYDSGMNDIQYGRVYDAWDEFNAQYGGGSNAGVHPVAAIYKYNDDGSLPAINLYSQMIMNIPGYNASYYGFIQQDWKLCQIQGLFPKISPLYSDDVSNMPQLSSEGMDDETMFDGAKSKQKVEEIPEIIDGDINSGIIESTIKKSDIPNVDKQPEKAATLPFGSAACGDDKKGIRTEPTTGDGGLN